MDYERRSEAVERVNRLLDRLGDLDDVDVRELAAQWAAQDADARRRGWQRARTVIAQRGLDDVLVEAREAVGGWAGAARTDFSGIEGLLGRPGGQVGGRHGAAPAILDAVVAILAEGEVAADEQAALSTPWALVAPYGREFG